ncbi:hypothetical protein KAR91_46790 [Candidatus Pacearchaeota archaeon]|nr:hypothetical protein [Candidatus Pacearchaeota archaeon]
MIKKKLKSMTVRYGADKEKEIMKLLEITREKTMNKAFLKTPIMIQEQRIKIIRMSTVIEKQRDEIEKLKDIVNSWTNFNKKLENFLDKNTGENDGK